MPLYINDHGIYEGGEEGGEGFRVKEEGANGGNDGFSHGPPMTVEVMSLEAMLADLLEQGGPYASTPSAATAAGGGGGGGGSGDSDIDGRSAPPASSPPAAAGVGGSGGGGGDGSFGVAGAAAAPAAAGGGDDGGNGTREGCIREGVQGGAAAELEETVVEDEGAVGRDEGSGVAPVYVDASIIEELFKEVFGGSSTSAAVEGKG